jgi:hypothetical protein
VCQTSRVPSSGAGAVVSGAVDSGAVDCGAWTAVRLTGRSSPRRCRTQPRQIATAPTSDTILSLVFILVLFSSKR